MSSIGTFFGNENSFEFSYDDWLLSLEFLPETRLKSNVNSSRLKFDFSSVQFFPPDHMACITSCSLWCRPPDHEVCKSSTPLDPEETARRACGPSPSVWGISQCVGLNSDHQCCAYYEVSLCQGWQIAEKHKVCLAFFIFVRPQHLTERCCA